MSVKVEIPALPPLDVNRRYSVNPALNYLAISRGTFYKLVTENERDPAHARGIRTIKEGKRRLVPGSEIARLSAVPSAASQAA